MGSYKKILYIILILPGLLWAELSNVATQNNYGTSWDAGNKYIDDLVSKFIQSNNIDLSYPIIDLGCGYGQFSYSLVRHGASKVFALDLDPGHIKKLCASCPQDGYDYANCIVAIDGDFPGDPKFNNLFHNNSIGGIMALSVLHFLPADKIEHCLQSMHSILRPGGALLIKVRNECRNVYALAAQKVSEKQPIDFVAEDFYKTFPGPGKLEYPATNNLASIEVFKNYPAEKRLLLYPCQVPVPGWGAGFFHILFPENLSWQLNNYGYDNYYNVIIILFFLVL